MTVTSTQPTTFSSKHAAPPSHEALAGAINRALSSDLPQPPRHREAIRQSVDNLHPPANPPRRAQMADQEVNEEDEEQQCLPGNPPFFKVKMIEHIT